MKPTEEEVKEFRKFVESAVKDFEEGNFSRAGDKFMSMVHKMDSYRFFWND